MLRILVYYDTEDEVSSESQVLLRRALSRHASWSLKLQMMFNNPQGSSSAFLLLESSLAHMVIR